MAIGVAISFASALAVAVHPHVGGSVGPAGAFGGGLVLTALALVLLAALQVLFVRLRDPFQGILVACIAWFATVIPSAVLLYRPDAFAGRDALMDVVVAPRLIWHDKAVAWLGPLVLAAVLPAAALLARRRRGARALRRRVSPRPGRSRRASSRARMGPAMPAKRDRPPSLDRRWAELGLLPMKLGRPRLVPRTLERPRVDALVGAAALRPLTLVVAPAGAGKTAALAAWAARAGLTVAWWTVGDETATDTWLGYLLAALAAARPELTPSQWPGAAVEPTAWLAEHVVVPLCRKPDPITLVLDEVERAMAPAFWRALAWLVGHRPAALRLILAGRSPPPLALARLEAAGVVARVDAAALHFDAGETAAAGERIAGRPLDPSTQAWLFARTRGWPAGVRLLASGLAERPPPAPGEPTPLDRRALEFLAEEVFARQPAPRRRFLLTTAIVDELQPDLCAALCGSADARDELWRLADEGLFVAPVEGGGGDVWLRYHPLFQAMLGAHLASEPGLDVAALHARAARWYAAHGRTGRAIDHCERAGDAALAGELAAAHGFALVRRRALGELARVVDLARRAPAVAREPRLFVLAAWAAMPRGPAAIHAALAEARSALAGLDEATVRPLAGSLDCLAAFLELRGGSPEHGLVLARAALAGLGADSRGLTIALHLAAGLAAELLQRFPEALAHLEAAAAAAALLPAMPSLLPALAHRARILRRTGRLDEAVSAVDAATAASEAHGWADLAYLGEVALERALLLHARAAFAEAEAELLAGLARLRLGEERGDVVRGATALARIRRDLGDLPGAQDAADEAVQAAAELEPWIRALAELERDPTREPPAPEGPQGRLVRTESRLAAAEAALRARSPAAVHPSTLTAEQADADAAGRTLDAITAGVVRAALLAEADPAAAAQILSDMAVRARPARLRRPFVVHCERLRPLFTRLDEVARAATLALVGEPAPAADGEVLLSAREREVLAAIALGLPNQMIARRLFISLSTVKTHIQHIFAKLAVENRTAAVRRGRSLGLIAGD